MNIVDAYLKFAMIFVELFLATITGLILHGILFQLTGISLFQKLIDFIERENH